MSCSCNSLAATRSQVRRVVHYMGLALLVDKAPYPGDSWRLKPLIKPARFNSVIKDSQAKSHFIYKRGSPGARGFQGASTILRHGFTCSRLQKNHALIRFGLRALSVGNLPLIWLGTGAPCRLPRCQSPAGFGGRFKVALLVNRGTSPPRSQSPPIALQPANTFGQA